MIENRIKLRLMLIKEKALAQINEFKVSYMYIIHQIMILKFYLDLDERPGY
jgi:hypothetical protein